jgi:SAM-dependent methyltransferase
MDDSTKPHRPSAGGPIEDPRGFYEEVAEHRVHWKASRKEAFVQLDTLRYERIVAGVGRGHSVAVDLGCGSGVISALLGPRARMVIGVDLTHARLAQLRTHVPASRPLQGDATAIPLRDATASLVVASEVIEHLPDYLPSLREIARVLAPGGMGVVSVPYKEEREVQVCPHCHTSFPLHGHLHSFDENSLGAALREAGLQPRRWVTLNNAVATRVGRLLAAPYPLLKICDHVCRRLLPHMNRHLIMFARRPPES